jgi:hypothetical protein
VRGLLFSITLWGSGLGFGFAYRSLAFLLLTINVFPAISFALLGLPEFIDSSLVLLDSKAEPLFVLEKSHPEFKLDTSCV